MENSFELHHEDVDIASEKLLKREITGNEFLESLLQEDQKTDKHENARYNISVLEFPEVEKYFLEQTQEKLRDEYHNILSISYFHVAQIEAVANHSNVAEYFAKAHVEAENIQSKTFSDWRLYLFGTIKYFSQDTEGIDFAIQSMTNNVNKQVLQCLKDGLIKYGSIDYARDYINSNE